MVHEFRMLERIKATTTVAAVRRWLLFWTSGGSIRSVDVDHEREYFTRIIERISGW